jgi:hypothetical protein
MAMAHTVGDAVVRAYMRTDQFDKRRELAEAGHAVALAGPRRGAVGVAQVKRRSCAGRDGVLWARSRTSAPITSRAGSRASARSLPEAVRR